MPDADPIVLVALLLQVVVPLGLVAAVAGVGNRGRLRLGMDAAFAALYLVAIALAGLWLALPRWLVGVYALLLVGAVAVGMRRVPAGAAPRRFPWVRALAVSCTAGIVVLALVGRRPLPGPSVALAFPMVGGSYRVAAGGSNTLLNPHLGTLEGDRFRRWRGQSYAVDLVGVGAWGSRNSVALSPGPDGFAVFGVPIHAPCTGTVVAASDGEPDVLPPGAEPASLEGNHVILACGEVWVALAHMALGSVVVEAGESVMEGDLLGRVGNSGNSDEPHLHIHAQMPGQEREPLSGEPLPVTFDGRQPVRNDVIPGRPPGAVGPVASRVQAELDALHKEYGFPGATAAWLTEDGRTGVAATGVADLEAGRPMPRDARMLAASIGKSFVAATVLALAREGVLALDAPVARWLGRVPNDSSITVRHLLNHTSGLRDHVYDPDFRAWWAAALDEPGRDVPTPDSLVAFVLDDPPLFAPGEGWAYTDTGYLLLGMVVERASGLSVQAQIEARFLGPLGLSRTAPSDRRSIPGLVPGYVSEDNPFGLPVRTMTRDGELVWDPAVEGAGGGLASNSLDLVRWAGALFGGRAMEGPYLDELLAGVPTGPRNGDPMYGAGVAIHHTGPLGPTWGHAGSIPGYLSSMRYHPREGVAVAFQINTDSRFAGEAEADDVLAAMEIRLARAVAGRGREAVRQSGSGP